MAIGPAIALRALRGTADEIVAVQRLHERAADYVFNVTGLPPRETEGESFFSELPPGRSAEDKFCGALLEGEDWVGCVDIVRGWPDARTAIIGLLLLVPAARGRGVGEAALQRIEQQVGGWPGIDTLRVAVAASNAGALPFWRRMGFVAVGEPKPWTQGVVTTTVQPMQRPLRRGLA